MRKNRTKAEWQTLIDEFEQSHLSQAEFCAQRGLNAKYFSLRRMKLKAQPEAGAFVQAVADKPSSPHYITLQYGPVTLQVPVTSVQLVTQLVKALA
jgi:hypothetical protein